MGRASRSKRTKGLNVALNESIDSTSSAQTPTCPCCGHPIHPKLKDYLPRPGTFKQYKCEHCSAWLTIDIKSRLKLIAFGAGSLLLFCVGSAYVVIGPGLPVHEHPQLVIAPFAIAYVIIAHHLLAKYMRRVARWVSIDYAF